MAAELPRAGAPLAAPGLPPTEARSAATELQLRFSTDSWTEVYDADGRRLFYNLAAAHTERTLAGKAPLRVVLGSARGVDVSINGRSAEIPESALHRDVAEFVVNAAGRLATGR
jgi:cytoskeleton protein RodZ